MLLHKPVSIFHINFGITGNVKNPTRDLIMSLVDTKVFLPLQLTHGLLKKQLFDVQFIKKDLLKSICVIIL